MARTRLEIPIPQNPEPEPEPQPDLAFEFVEAKNGLLEFKAESTEAHIIAFRKVNDGIDDHYWSQGAIVASLTKKHGEKCEALDELGKAVDLAPGYLRQMGRTWRTFQFVSRDTELSFTIHKVACRHPNPGEALAVAKARGFSKNELNGWISEQSLRRADRATRRARNAARNDWRQHLMHMDSVIVNDFIQNSPNKEFARRVCGGWREEIADELKQIEVADNRELVMMVIDERGAEDVKAIRKATGLETKDIEWIVGQLVEENLYEYVRKGGKPDQARGDRGVILHKVGTPIGD